MKRILVLTLCAMGCAGEPPKKETTVYIEATKEAEVPALPRVIPVPIATPVPGQLRPAPQMIAPTEDQVASATEAARGKKVWEVVDAANAAAKSNPIEEGFFNAIQVYDFAPGVLYQLYGAPMRLTAIEFEENEKVISVAVGDTIRWIVGQTTSGNKQLVLVKPVRAGLHTNMVLTTDRRVYQMELHSFNETYMASVSWNYPYALVNRYDSAEVPQPADVDKVSMAVGVESLNFDYGFVVDDPEDPPSWMPVRVYDDGEKTYVQFRPDAHRRDLPALFVLSKKGTPQVVNFRVRGDLMVVDRTFDLGQLRLGEDSPITVGIERFNKGGR